MFIVSTDNFEPHERIENISYRMYTVPIIIFKNNSWYFFFITSRHVTDFLCAFVKTILVEAIYFLENSPLSKSCGIISMPVTTVTFIKHILIICTVSSYDTSSSALPGRTQRIIYVTTTARRYKYRSREQITVGTWHCRPPNPAVSICSHNTFRCVIITMLPSVLRIITGLQRPLIRSERIFI